MNEHKAPYPFFRTMVHLPDGEGLGEFKTWAPGTRGVFVYPDDTESVADGMGSIVLTEVSRHKPGRYPERVFYVREWIDPDGKRFGKPKLRMTTSAAFARLCKGYRHEFEMAGQPGREGEEG